MRRLGLLALTGLAALTGCNRELRANRVDPASFKVEMLCSGTSSSNCPTKSSEPGLCVPTDNAHYRLDLGTANAPVAGDEKFYLANVTAIGNNGDVYEPYEGTANVYVMFNGSVSPQRNSLTEPAQKLAFKGGKACLRFTMPPAFNQTAIWVEDSGEKRNSGSWAVGASPAIYRQPPTLEDIQRTDDGRGASPLNLKQVIIKGGTNGKSLVVTSTTQSSFTVTDLGADGVDHEWGSLLVYTFSKPYGVHQGMTVKNLAGALSEFNGLTELNFPSWEIEDRHDGDDSLIPKPHLVTLNDLTQPLAKMEPYESALVQVNELGVCPIINSQDSQDFERYGQWKIAPIVGGGVSAEACDRDNELQHMSVVSNQAVPSFNPKENRGKKICTLKGILSNVAFESGGNIWIVNPRSPDDLGDVVEATQPCD